MGLRDAIHVYSPKTRTLLKTLAKPGNSVALSPRGLLAAAGKNSVRVWRTSGWSETLSLTNYSAPLAFSPDGRFLAAKSQGAVRILNSSTGEIIAEIPNSSPPFAFNDAADRFAVDTREGILLWDLRPGRSFRLLDDSKGVFNHSAGWMRDKNALAFSTDGKSVIAARNIIKNDSVFVLDVWSAESGARAPSIPTQPIIIEHTGAIAEIAIAPKGQLLASAGWDHSVRVWSLDSRQRLRVLRGSPSEVWTLSFAPDGESIITGGKDGAVRQWPTNPTTTDESFESKGMPLGFSKDGEVMAVIDDDSKLVTLNIKTGEPEAQIQLSKAPPGFLSAAVSDDLKVLIEGLAEGFRVWDLPSGQSVDVPNPDKTKSQAVISPDGGTFLAQGKQDSLLWWNLHEPSEPPRRVAGKAARFSGDGKILLTLSDKSFNRWDAKTRAVVAEVTNNFTIGFFSAVALSCDGTVLAIGSDPVHDPENTIHLFDTQTGNLLGVCRGHTQGVRWLAFAPEGETLASVGDDSTLRFWNLRTQQELFSIRELANPARDIRFSSDGRWLAVKSMRGLRLLDGSEPSH